jgi:hypothetical protein
VGLGVQMFHAMGSPNDTTVIRNEIVSASSAEAPHHSTQPRNQYRHHDVLESPALQHHQHTATATIRSTTSQPPEALRSPACDSEHTTVIRNEIVNASSAAPPSAHKPNQGNDQSGTITYLYQQHGTLSTPENTTNPGRDKSATITQLYTTSRGPQARTRTHVMPRTIPRLRKHISVSLFSNPM